MFYIVRSAARIAGYHCLKQQKMDKLQLFLARNTINKKVILVLNKGWMSVFLIMDGMRLNEINKKFATYTYIQLEYIICRLRYTYLVLCITLRNHK